ncbi:hypothetical protein BJ742DRAFT_379077 [Cladochytrium replicatum]|nr:hypothetical protein BJ742DRAFT_379077 [Cladochytrium replicatum]
MSTAVNALAAIGALCIVKIAVSLISGIAARFSPPLNLIQYGAKKGSWAVVTGASDGIGKEFALQLAQAGFNVALLARTSSKLELVAGEIAVQNSNKVRTEVIPFDFAKSTASDYASLATRLTSLGDIGVLVNNVGVSHEFPVPFIEESAERTETIVNVNILAQLRITRIVLPGMIARKSGLILNLSSFAGKFPSALLSVYSASKAFLANWSECLGIELKGTGVHVECLNTFFVQTAMSKIRKTSISTPSAKDYVKTALSNSGKALVSTPYWSHAIADWVVTELVPKWLLVSQGYELHKSIRKRALRKQEREAKKQ